MLFDRFLNSGLFMGYAPEIYRMLSLKEVEDKDDDQLYFTMIYLDEKLRVSEDNSSSFKNNQRFIVERT